MSSFAEPFAALPALNQVTVPDLWQQQAVTALREGKDVVVQAPTGAGKTLIFELWSNAGKNRGQAIYTVPTRALANDKLAEWRARGWDVGIATGDLAENLHAPILVATLETQKNRLIQGEGPALLVVDEYQMIGDADRGLNYELALALAPPHTQLLLLSGSVANPQSVVNWLQRLGRSAVLIRYEHRPVPLEEIHANSLNFHVPAEIRGYWPRLMAKALAEDLGPILIFAPRRAAAESMAAELARNLPIPNPLQLTAEQKLLAGEHLAKLLRSRIAFHHSGLSYGARAGVIEPLAKAGQLRIVVATMGLAAGINFSLRSVALAAASYRRDQQEQPLRADEILQMFGRAGRRGLDETGYVLITANEIRLLDAHTGHLARSAAVDWSALLGIMALAAKNHRDPFSEAVRVQERLFTTKPIVLGVEESLKHPDVPCGLKTDAERARHVRQFVRQMRNSAGEWQEWPEPAETPLKEIWIYDLRFTNDAPPENPGGEITGRTPQITKHSVLSEPAALEKLGPGNLCILSESDGVKTYGRSVTVAELFNATAKDGLPGSEAVTAKPPSSPSPPSGERAGERGLVLAGDPQSSREPQTPHPIPLPFGRGEGIGGEQRVIIAKWVRRLVNWNGRQTTLAVWNEQIAPLLEAKLAGQKTPVVRFLTQGHRLVAQLSIAELILRVPVDRRGVALWNPAAREVLSADCASCTLVPICRELSAATGTALLWRRLGLVDAAGVPTQRGLVVSYFSHGDGLAIAAALQDSRYPLDELIYDLANLDAGFRFCGEENRWGGRLAMACHQVFGQQTIPGYLENGVPPKYGAGAEQVVASVHKNPLTKHNWITDLLGAGDIDRIIIEWRSLLRQITHAPDLEWARWRQLQALARAILQETESPTLTTLPALEYGQTKRIDHRLVLRRH